jgi:hypothetical protein
MHYPVLIIIIIIAVLPLEEIHNHYYPSRAVKQHWWQLIFGWVAA